MIPKTWCPGCVLYTAHENEQRVLLRHEPKRNFALPVTHDWLREQTRDLPVRRPRGAAVLCGHHARTLRHEASKLAVERAFAQEESLNIAQLRERADVEAAILEDVVFKAAINYWSGLWLEEETQQPLPIDKLPWED